MQARVERLRVQLGRRRRRAARRARDRAPGALGRRARAGRRTRAHRRHARRGRRRCRSSSLAGARARSGWPSACCRRRPSSTPSAPSATTRCPSPARRPSPTRRRSRRSRPSSTGCAASRPARTRPRERIVAAGCRRRARKPPERRRGASRRGCARGRGSCRPGRGRRVVPAERRPAPARSGAALSRSSSARRRGCSGLAGRDPTRCDARRSPLSSSSTSFPRRPSRCAATSLYDLVIPDFGVRRVVLRADGSAQVTTSARRPTTSRSTASSTGRPVALAPLVAGGAPRKLRGVDVTGRRRRFRRLRASATGARRPLEQIALTEPDRLVARARRRRSTRNGRSVLADRSTSLSPGRTLRVTLADGAGRRWASPTRWPAVADIRASRRGLVGARCSAPTGAEVRIAGSEAAATALLGLLDRAMRDRWLRRRPAVCGSSPPGGPCRRPTRHLSWTAP